MLGVYVHLPFCPYLCPYCDFAKWPLRAASARRYFEALYAELEREAAGAGRHDLPRRRNAERLRCATIAAGMLARLRERFRGAGEISIEVNPELVRDGDLSALIAKPASAAFRSACSPSSRARFKRSAESTPSTQIERVVASARFAELRSVSLDLMFAVPGQTPASWRHTLRARSQLDVDHISAYGLTVEEARRMRPGARASPAAFFDDVREAELYAIAIETLQAAGYEQYEISNFARPGHRCAHNLNYWANGEYVGLGVGAASYRDGRAQRAHAFAGRVRRGGARRAADSVGSRAAGRS